MATQLLHAAGIEYKVKVDGDDVVVLVCYGEGGGAESWVRDVGIGGVVNVGGVEVRTGDD